MKRIVKPFEQKLFRCQFCNGVVSYRKRDKNGYWFLCNNTDCLTAFVKKTGKWHVVTLDQLKTPLEEIK